MTMKQLANVKSSKVYQTAEEIKKEVRPQPQVVLRVEVLSELL